MVKNRLRILDKMEYTDLGNNKEITPYNLEGFSPIIIDEDFLLDIGVREFNKPMVEKIEKGSLLFRELYEDEELTAQKDYGKFFIDSKTALEFHNYTGICPRNVLELTPCIGSCSISCLYCLAHHDSFVDPIIVYENYPELVRNNLEKFKDRDMFFYFSPKTEAFSEPLLESGVSHEILRKFIEHYDQNPESRTRLFIASKAGPKHLMYEDKGDSILSLLSCFKDKIQFNGSIGIMPEKLQQVLEPNAPSLENRLKAMEMLQDKGIYAKSVLTQPIIPNYLEKLADEYICKLNDSGIINIKPEFLTASMEKIALVSQYINYFDKNSLKDFLKLYVAHENRNHIKQGLRTAPDRGFSLQGFKVLHEKAKQKGISISICNWVKSQLPGKQMKEIEKEASKRGFRCLGYQENIFKNNWKNET